MFYDERLEVFNSYFEFWGDLKKDKLYTIRSWWALAAKSDYLPESLGVAEEYKILEYARETINKGSFQKTYN